MNEVHVGCHCLSIVKHVKQKNRKTDPGKKKKKTRKSHFTVTFPTLKQKQIHIKKQKRINTSNARRFGENGRYPLYTRS